MQRSTRISLVVIAVCIIGLVLYFALNRPKPSDSALIAQQIDTAVSGANLGSPGKILDVVSPNYKDPAGHDKDDLHFVLVRALTSRNDLNFALSNLVINVDGNEATTEADLLVTDRQTKDPIAQRHLNIQWQREPSRKWLIFPDTVWQVTSSDADFDDPMQ